MLKLSSQSPFQSDLSHQIKTMIVGRITPWEEVTGGRDHHCDVINVCLSLSQTMHLCFMASKRQIKFSVFHNGGHKKICHYNGEGHMNTNWAIPANNKDVYHYEKFKKYIFRCNCFTFSIFIQFFFWEPWKFIDTDIYICYHHNSLWPSDMDLGQQWLR